MRRVVQRRKGRKPAISINEEKFYVKMLCPDPTTVPIGVDIVWCLITSKCQIKKNIKKIAVASIYYSVKVPTRLNPATILDPIFTTLHQFTWSQSQCRLSEVIKNLETIGPPGLSSLECVSKGQSLHLMRKSVLEEVSNSSQNSG